MRCVAAATFAALMVSPVHAGASVGLAEWEVLTPGGHRIAHSDRWKSEHGDCLVPAGASSPVVSRIVRWRYFKGQVAGQTKSGFFLFDEKSKGVTPLASLAALEQAIKKQRLGQPLSDWYTSQDGWSEAYFPLMIWRYCTPPGPAPKEPPLPPDLKAQMEKMNKATQKMYKPACDRFLSVKGLALGGLTTWGQECRKAAREKTKLETPLDAWCKLLLARPRAP